MTREQKREAVVEAARRYEKWHGEVVTNTPEVRDLCAAVRELDKPEPRFSLADSGWIQRDGKNYALVMVEGNGSEAYAIGCGVRARLCDLLNRAEAPDA